MISEPGVCYGHVSADISRASNVVQKCPMRCCQAWEKCTCLTWQARRHNDSVSLMAQSLLVTKPDYGTRQEGRKYHAVVVHTVDERSGPKRRESSSVPRINPMASHAGVRATWTPCATDTTSANFSAHSVSSRASTVLNDCSSRTVT